MKSSYINWRNLVALKGRLFPKWNRIYSLKLFLKERNSYSKQHRTEVVAHELDVNLSEYIFNIFVWFWFAFSWKNAFFWRFCDQKE